MSRFGALAAAAVLSTAAAGVAAPSATAQQADTFGVFAGAHDTTVGAPSAALLNATLGGLTTGNALAVTQADWGTLAGGRIAFDDLLAAVRDAASLPTPSAAATHPQTLSDLVAAAAGAAGDPALGSALNRVAAAFAGLPGTITVASLAAIDPADPRLGDASMSALDLAVAAAQRHNFEHASGLPTPVSVTGAALGRADVVAVDLAPLVVTPPRYVRGSGGETFSGAAVRLALDVDIVDVPVDTTTLNAALGALGNASSSATLERVPVLVDVQAGTGTLDAVDAVADAVTFQSRAGAANAYLGTMSTDFFDRTKPVDAALSLTSRSVGPLNIRITAPIVGTVLTDVTTGLTVRSTALPTWAGGGSTTITGPFPAPFTAGTSTTTDLQTLLTSNLALGVSSNLGTLLNPLTNGTILPTLKPRVQAAATTPVQTAVGGVADPAGEAMGATFGRRRIDVDRVSRGDRTAPSAPALATTPSSPAASLAPRVSGTAEAGSTVALYASTDCTGAPVATGTAAELASPGFAVTVAAGTTTPFTATATDAAGNTSACSAVVRYVHAPASAPGKVAATPVATVAAAPAPAAPAPAATCDRTRSITLNVLAGAPRGTKLRRTVVRVDGRVVRTLGRGQTRLTLPFRDLRAGAITVTLDATATDGARLRGTRRYRVCRGAGAVRPMTPLRRVRQR